MKLPQIMAHIRDHYDGFTLSGDVIWRIAAECEVARATVYNAVNRLIAMKAVNEKRVYEGRAFIPTAELIQHLPDAEYPFIWDYHRDTLVKTLFTTQSALYFSVDWAIKSGAIKTFASGNSYGWLLQVSRDWTAQHAA